MSMQQLELNSVVPDLQSLSAEQLASLGDSALARSLALYNQRLDRTSLPYCSFNATI